MIPRTNGKLRWRPHPVTPRRECSYGDDTIGWGRVRYLGVGRWLAIGPRGRSQIRATVGAARRYVENQVDAFLRVPRRRVSDIQK